MPSAVPPPSEEEVRSYFESCKNWGRWGNDDNAGTINLITPQVRRDATALVQQGRAISLARPWNTQGGPGNWNPAQHFVRATGTGSTDYIGINYHGFATTHIDALCHIFWQGSGWNGNAPSDVTSLGAEFGSIDAWSMGILTRGVLIDVPRFRGVEFVAQGEPVRGWEVEAAAEQQGVEVRSGDAVVIYSGREKYYAVNPLPVLAGQRERPGLHPDVCPVLKKYDAALLVWDQHDALPTGYEMFDNPERPALPVHSIAIPQMGMPLLDNSLLQPLAEACAEENRYEFMLTVNPLHIQAATGSPVNPIAVF